MTTFDLVVTGAFSQNVSKLFSELKLVTDNLSLKKGTVTQVEMKQNKLLVEGKCFRMISQSYWSLPFFGDNPQEIRLHSPDYFSPGCARRLGTRPWYAGLA